MQKQQHKEYQKTKNIILQLKILGYIVAATAAFEVLETLVLYV